MNPEADESTRRQAALLEEYRSLRAEIEHSSQERLRLLAFTGTIWAGLATWMASHSEFFSVEVSLMVLHTPLVLAYVILKLLNRHVMRASTYIRQFIEPEVEGLRWETRVADFQRESSVVLSTSQVIVIALLLMSSGSIALGRALGLPYQLMAFRFLDVISGLLLWCVFACFELFILLEKGSRSYEKTAASLWRSLRTGPSDTPESEEADN